MNVALGFGLKQRCLQNLSAQNDNIPTVIKAGPVVFALKTPVCNTKQGSHGKYQAYITQAAVFTVTKAYACSTKHYRSIGSAI